MATKIEIERNDEWVRLDPDELTIDELCEVLERIDLGDSDSYGNFRPEDETKEGYAAIAEAIRRLEAIQHRLEKDTNA